MCGILGSFGWLPSDRIRSEANHRLAKRGPDGLGHWVSESQKVWLSHRRLAIQDLSDAGSQPMHHPDRPEIVITYNGEIYNYASLRRKLEAKGCRIRSTCDTELLLHAYTTWGTSLFTHVEGMFAFAIWDGVNQQAFLARDPMGQKPLYYHSCGPSLRFGSNTDALRAMDPSIDQASPLALRYVLTLGYVPAPHSVWSGVAAIEAGHFLIWTADHGPRVQRYWAPPDRTDGIQDSVAFSQLFREICAEHMIADVPVGVLLSGGLDSTCVTKTLVDAGTHAPLTITLDFANSRDSEAHIARDTAQRLGLPNTSVKLETGEIDKLRRRVALASPEPQGYSALLTWFVAAAAVANHFKVALSGDGGDELLGGYTWYRDLSYPRWKTYFRWGKRSILREDARSSERVAAMMAFAQQSLLHRHAMRVFPRFLPEEARMLFAPLGGAFDDDIMLEPLRKHFVPNLPVQNALQRVDLQTFCTGSILAKTDHMSMAHSLEVRAPFLDRRLVDWALSHRTAPAIAGEEKKPVRDYLRGTVPDAVLSHPKQGFSLRGMESYNYDALENEIRSSRLARDGLLSEKFTRIVEPGSPYRNARLWTLASIALWYDQRATSDAAMGPAQMQNPGAELAASDQ